jgi:hypothetical protein
MYKHYVRANENSIVIYGFCEIEEDFIPNDILIDDNAPRQFNLKLQNEKFQYLYKIVNGILTLRTEEEMFDLVQYRNDKIDLLSSIANGALQTFKSSALGSEHTYLSGMSDMLLLTGEYTYIKGDDYQGENPLWYTLENGNLEHTKAQFVQIYLDCRTHVQTIKYHGAVLTAQVNAAIDKASVDAIVW